MLKSDVEGEDSETGLVDGVVPPDVDGRLSIPSTRGPARCDGGPGRGPFKGTNKPCRLTFNSSYVPEGFYSFQYYPKKFPFLEILS